MPARESRRCSMRVGSKLLREASTPLPSIATARAVGELIQELLRGSQVGGCKSFGESAIHRSQLIARITEPALATPQPGETRGRPQFPRQNLLPARPIERLQKLRLRRRAGV